MRWTFILILLALLLPPFVWAHKVNVFAYVEDGKVYTESYFSDGSPCKKARIEVYDKSDNKLLEGITDEKGIFVFPVPKRDELKIVLIAGMGHRAETTLRAEDVGESPAEVSSPMTVNMDELKKAMREAVREGINPLVRTIEREKSRVRFGEVIGGIGYILGIWGTISLILSRREKGR